MPSGERPFPRPPSLHPSIHPLPSLFTTPYAAVPAAAGRGRPMPSTLPPAPTPRLPTLLVTDKITSMPVPLHVRSHRTAASWGGGTRERRHGPPLAGRRAGVHTHFQSRTRVHDIETRVCGYGRYIAGACSRGLGCPLLVKAVRVACCEEWRCSCLVHRASSAPACDSAR